MNKLYHFFGALDARNLFVLATLVCLLFAACAKSEIAQDDSIMNAAQAAAAGETQDDPAGDDQGNSDDPNSGDPSDPDSPAQYVDGYISPDHFNMVQMTFGACSDAEEDTRSTGLFSRESAFEREEPLDDSVQETFSVKTSLDGSGNILWTQGDKIKVYYAEGESNFKQGTIKHGGESSSTIDAEVNNDLDYFYAFYPVGVTSSATFETADPKTYGSITVTIPNPQNATDNNFANCHMAVGKASKAEKQFAFSNVGSYLKMQVADLTATSLTIKSIAGQNITGTFTVPFTDADGTIGTPTVDSGSSEITVNLPSGRPSPITIYVMLLPGVNFTKGFLVRYNYQDGITRPSFVYDSGKEVVRRMVLNLGDLDGRIITDWFIKSDGTRTNPSGREALPSGSKATCGSSWDLALSATGLYNLLNANGDADLRKAQAARLDGATLHFANGTYTVPEMVLNGTGYGENVNLTMYGGYPTGNTGTSTSGRSTNNHLTVISGNKANRIFDMGTKFEVSMDNFMVTEGKVDGSTATGDAGAIQMLGTTATDCKLTVNQVWFYDNYVENQPDGAGSGIGSGGAIALKRGMLTATNSIFEKGSARNAGGVLVAGQSGTNKAVATFTNCQFKDNETQTNCGAGFSGNGGQITLTGCSFTSNVAACYGGGVHWDPQSSPGASLSMTDCTFTSNCTLEASGNNGGGFSCESGTATLSRCTFTSNATGLYGTKGAGGGAVWAQGTVNASDCTFTGNSGTKGGGAIWVSSTGTLNLTGTNTFYANRCTSYVDGSSNTQYGEGGAIYVASTTEGEIVGGTVSITGATTFQENYSVVNGGAICCKGGTLTIQNNGANRPFFDRNYTTTTTEFTMGAGIFVSATSATINLTGVDFDANYMKAVPYHNVTCEGASITLESGSATVLNFSATDCGFTNSYSSGNKLNSDSSATARNGGVLRLNVSTSNEGTVSFANCRFTNNRSYNVGGVATHKSGTVSYSGCTFTGNISSAFSSVYHHNNEAATANFTNCFFTGNSLTSTHADHGYGSVCRIEKGTVTMESCTLRGNTSAGQHGGVIALNDGTSTLNLKGSTIEGNSYTNATKTNLLGGAIYYGAGTLSITSSDGKASGTKSVIRANTGSNPNGYGLYVASGLTPTLEYCTFDAQNSSGTVSPTSGYAIYYAGTAGTETLTMTGCEIKNFNRATNTGLWWTNLLDVTNHTAPSTLSFSGCTFSGHTASGDGGVFNYTSTVPYTISTLSNCTFSGNSATNRGGVFFTDKDLVLSGCTLQNNGAGVDGGSIYVNGGDLTLSNCTVSGNHSDNNGGAILIRNSGSDMTATGCAFTGNYAGTSGDWFGGALYNSNDINNVVSFEKCVFDGNQSAYCASCIYMGAGAFLKMNQCLLQNNYTRSRGVIYCGSNVLAYLNRVAFYNNYNTGTDGWGVCIHAGNANICMNSVTSYNNRCTHATPGFSFVFNSDGGWLITSCTIMDPSTSSSASGLIRTNNNDKTTTVCNNILINTSQSENVFYFVNSGRFTDRGYNVLSCTQNHRNATLVDGDKKGVTSLPSGNFNFSASLSKPYGVYAWSGTLTGFTQTTVGGITNAMGSYYEYADPIRTSITNIGYNFYEWLQTLSPEGVKYDGRAVYRAEWGSNTWPGAYHGH